MQLRRTEGRGWTKEIPVISAKERIALIAPWITIRANISVAIGTASLTTKGTASFLCLTIAEHGRRRADNAVDRSRDCYIRIRRHGSK